MKGLLVIEWSVYSENWTFNLKLQLVKMCSIVKIFLVDHFIFRQTGQAPLHVSKETQKAILKIELGFGQK